MHVQIKLPDKEHFSISQLASILDVSAASVWRYVRRGIRGRPLPSFRIGGRRRVARADLLAWLEAINDDRGQADHGRGHEQHARQAREADAVLKMLEAEGL
jgi:excisionase family DNA binding protein